jgi:heme exporter protein D
MMTSQNIKNNTSKLFGLLVFALSFLVGTSFSYAATLQLNPGTGSYSSGQTFTAAVRVVPAGQNVNAVEATLKYDPAVLSVVSVSKDGSAFSLWTVEPTFSNAAGTITFGGGSPSPFSATSNLINVTFRTVKEGTGSVSFSSASVLAADGRGTDVYQTSPAASFTIAAATTPTTPTPTPTPTPTTPTTPKPEAGDTEEALIFGDPPRAPEIGSTAFIDPEVWYKTTDGVFTWTIPFDVNAMAIEISTSTTNVPSDNEEAILIPPVDEFRITKDIVTDGVQYLSIQYKNQVDWGAVLNRKLQIDTSAPEPFEVVVRAGTTPSSFPLIIFEAKDKTSGISHYEMTIAGNEPIRVTPDEAKLGYLLRDLEDGTYTVKVLAYDLAGNIRESSKAVLITAGWIKPAEELEKTSFWDFFSPTNLLIILLVIVIILQTIFVWYERKILRQKEDKLRRETREIQDQMEKIFSALRDEIYDQVNMITKRKRLSKNEKDAVEGLNQALEVSETLIEKEINDVKAILK